MISKYTWILLVCIAMGALFVAALIPVCLQQTFNDFVGTGHDFRNTASLYYDVYKVADLDAVTWLDHDYTDQSDRKIVIPANTKLKLTGARPDGKLTIVYESEEAGRIFIYDQTLETLANGEELRPIVKDALDHYDDNRYREYKDAVIRTVSICFVIGFVVAGLSLLLFMFLLSKITSAKAAPDKDTVRHKRNLMPETDDRPKKRYFPYLAFAGISAIGFITYLFYYDRMRHRYFAHEFSSVFERNLVCYHLPLIAAVLSYAIFCFICSKKYRYWKLSSWFKTALAGILGPLAGVMLWVMGVVFIDYFSRC